MALMTNNFGGNYSDSWRLIGQADRKRISRTGGRLIGCPLSAIVGQADRLAYESPHFASAAATVSRETEGLHCVSLAGPSLA